ncbi:MAG: TatD family hydrolase [Myxococcota bacterium]|nr:TatD family hydrolase [Myxococcota bacterium]
MRYDRLVIDTHCHLDVAAFEADREEVVARATRAGVIGVLVPAIRPRTWGALGALARQHAAVGVRCAIGIHPQIVHELEPDERSGDLVRRIADVATEAGAVAVGECGLDGATAASAAEREVQATIFRAHLRAARELGKPVVIHVFRAHDAAPRILREERVHEVGGVLHSYSGGAALVPVYRDLGLAFSFAGPITYANARRPIEAARAIPADLLLVETDAPDQAPAPHRGGRSEPAFLPAVIAGLATARATSAAEIAALTTANARRLFGVPAWR